MSFQLSPVAPDPDLAKLLSQVAASNRVAFAALYEHTNAKLHGIIVRILTRSDLAGDALQETYVRIWQKARDFDPNKGTAMAWMGTIARNRALDEVRRVKPLALDDMPDNFEPAAEEFDPLGSRERGEKIKIVMHCLSKLDAQKRELIMLAYYRGATREALSKRFGAPVPTIKTQLRRALLDFKGCLLVNLPSEP